MPQHLRFAWLFFTETIQYQLKTSLTGFIQKTLILKSADTASGLAAEIQADLIATHSPFYKVLL